MARPVLFILGMHAGGLTDVASVLAEAGAAFGADASPAIGDPRAFVSARLTALSDEALRRMGIAWDSPVALPEGAERNEALRDLAPAAADAIAREYPGGGAVIVADPRLCRLLPFWRDAFEQSRFAPSAAIVIRRPREVATALARHAQFAPEKSLALWHHHLIEAERGSRGLPRSLVTFEQWQSDPQATLSRIAADARFPLAMSNAAKVAARKIAPKHVNGADGPAGSMQSGLDTVLEAAYRKLGALPAGADPAREVEALAASARPAMIAAVAPWISAELDTARELSARLAAELASTRQKLEASAGELGALRAQNAPDAALLAAQLDALREDRARERTLMVDELTKTRGEIVRLTTVVAEAPRAADVLRRELSQAHRDLDDERATITRLAEELETTRRDADGYAKRFESAHHHLEALAMELAQARDTAMSREHDYTIIADELDTWRNQVSDLEGERDKLRLERDHAMRELSRLAGEVDVLRRERDGAVTERDGVNEAMRQSGQALAVLRDELPRRAASEAQLTRERDGLAVAHKAGQEKIVALEALLGDRSQYIGELVQRHNGLAARLNELEKRALVRAAVRMGGGAKRK